MDLIGKIYLASSKGHNFILVATYYFTKWVKAVPLKKVNGPSYGSRFGINRSQGVGCASWDGLICFKLCFNGLFLQGGDI